MGTFKTCIPVNIPADLRRALNEAADRWEKATGDRTKAELAAINAMEERNAANERVAVLSANANADLAKNIGKLPGKAAADWLESRIETSTKGVGLERTSASVEQRVAHDVAAGHMKDFRDLGANTPRKEANAVSADIMRELGGVETGNAAAKKAAASLRTGLDWLKAEFNRLGGAIKTRGNYLLPQTWDAAKIREAGGRDAFVEKLAAYYETLGVMDPLLGPHGAPMEGDELRGALGQIHDTITTGSTQSTIGQVAGAMRGRHLDPRSISFRDVNARIEAATQFGNPNVFEVADQHLATMSQEIGAMRVFGPHPDLAYTTARELAQQRGASPTRLVFVDNTYKAMAGSINSPASANLALGGQMLRGGLSAGLLPLSLASQVADVVPISLTSSMAGIPAMRTLTNGLKQVVGLGLKKEELTQIGVVVDGMLAHLHHTGVLDAASGTRRFVDANMRFYGIKQWAEGMTAGAETTMLGHLASLRGESLAEADAAMNGTLSRLGWTEKLWDDVRTHGVIDVGGAKFASVNAIAESSLSDAEKRAAQSQLVYTSRRFASLAMTIPDAKVRGITTQGTQVGTIPGEVIRNTMMFKSFGTQFLLNQVGQIIQQPTRYAAVGYGAKVLAGTTALGMVSLQIKRLLKGQGLAEMDPRTEEGRHTWVGAVFQGGGFGILGDAFGGAFGQNRFGQGPISSLLGPWIGALDDASKLTFGNAGAAARGEQTNFASEAGKLAGRYAPFVNAPFMGIAYQRYVIDQYRLWADPSGTRRSFMSMEQRRREDYGSRYWWRPGETRPEFAR